MACRAGSPPEVINALLAAGAKPDLVNKDSKTATDLAIENPLKVDAEKMASVVHALAKHSLFAAAQAGQTELVAERLAKGADSPAHDGYLLRN